MVVRYELMENSLGPIITDAQWHSEMMSLTRHMNAYLASFRSPIFNHYEKTDEEEPYGESNGTASYIECENKIFLLTNHHVVNVRNEKRFLGHRFENLDDLPRIIGNHISCDLPFDLGLLPVNDEAWKELNHSSRAIGSNLVASVHAPVDGEILCFSGYPGATNRFSFGQMNFGAITYLGQAKQAIKTEFVDPEFHFEIEYSPDLATSVLAKADLPRPNGFSGSTVWNTRFVESIMNGEVWAPEKAVVTGVVWGWPSGSGTIAATKVEYVNQFVSNAVAKLELKF